MKNCTFHAMLNKCDFGINLVDVIQNLFKEAGVGTIDFTDVLCVLVGLFQSA